jgi:plastocyanin
MTSTLGVVRSLVRSLASVAVLVLATASLALADSNTVTIQNSRFDPAVVSIDAGDSVTWTNRDAIPHSVRWTSDGPNDSGAIGKDQSYHQTFNSGGAYSYVCGIHGASMAGLVLVSGQQTAPPTPRSSPPTQRPSSPPPPTPSPSPSESPTPSPSPTTSPTPSATAGPTITPSPTPSATALTAPAAQANTLIGIALIAVGASILAGAFWWRFGQT